MDSSNPGTLRTRLHEQLEELARAFFGDEELTLRGDMTPADVPGWDSVAQVSFVFSIEEAFDIRFSDAELAGFSTIEDLERRIERKLKGEQCTP